MYRGNGPVHCSSAGARPKAQEDCCVVFELSMIIVSQFVSQWNTVYGSTAGPLNGRGSFVYGFGTESRLGPAAIDDTATHGTSVFISVEWTGSHLLGSHAAGPRNDPR
ncbi:unnamed protein product, partial [Iphiclides podalirius]